MANKIMYKYNKNSLKIYFINYACGLLLSGKQAAPQPRSPRPPRLYSDPLPSVVSLYWVWFKIRKSNLPAHHDMVSDLRGCLPESESFLQTASLALIKAISTDQSCSILCSSIPCFGVGKRGFHLLFCCHRGMCDIRCPALLVGFILSLLFLKQKLIC